MPQTLAEAARRLNAQTRRNRPPKAGRRAPPPYLFLMTDPRLDDPVAAARRLPRGAAVILRHYDAPAREVLGRRLAAVCRTHGLVFLVAGDWRLAARLKADGLHLPEGVLRGGRLAPALGWRQRSAALLTAAVHNGPALMAAARLEPDAVLLSPVFATASHPESRPLGPSRFGVLARRSPVPVIALGGVDDRSVRRLMQRGVWGVAAVTALSGPR